jgi:hypothetical protein
VGATREFRVTLLPAPDCTSTLTGRHTGELQVRAGVTCLRGAHIGGDVLVASGATLIAENATIAGALTSAGAATVELIGSTIRGSTRIAGTTGALVVFNSTLQRAVSLLDNQTATPPMVAGNRLSGVPTCTGNRAQPTDHGTANTMQGRTVGPCFGT